MKKITFERTKNYKIKGNITVKVTSYNNGEIEVKGSKCKQNNLTNYKKISKTEYVNTKTGEIKQYKNTEYKRIENVKRAMKNLNDILKNNFTGGTNEIFLTLTCEENITDYDYVREKAEGFIKKLRQTYKGLEYVFVMEQQERGSWHIHIWIKDTLHKKLYIDNEEVYTIWKLGYTKTERVEATAVDVEKTIGYMKKTRGKEKLPADKKAYYKSRGIKKAKTEEMQYERFYNEMGKSAVYVSGITLHVKSAKTGKIINTHFKETWKEDKHNEER